MSLRPELVLGRCRVVRPRNESCELLPLRADAVPTGMFADTPFAARNVQLEKDDILVAYTDGITEAANSSGEQWGMESLERLLRSCCQKSPRQIVECILAELSDFTDGETQRDDETLLVMKVQAGCEI